MTAVSGVDARPHLNPMSPTFLPCSAARLTFSPPAPGWLLSVTEFGSGCASFLGTVSRISLVSSSPGVEASTVMRVVPAGERMRRSCCQLRVGFSQLTMALVL